MAIKVKPHTAGWLLFIVYSVGYAGFQFSETKGLMRELIWVNLLLTLIVLLIYHKKWDKNFILTSLFLAFLSTISLLLGNKGLNDLFLLLSYLSQKFSF